MIAAQGPAGAFVGAMFEVIDGRRFNELPKFFHVDVVYRRPGFPDVVGLADLMDFYARRRIIAEGCHTVERLTSDRDSAVAVGVFCGRLKDGTGVDEAFADAYAFREGLIVDRRTFFFRPAI